MHASSITIKELIDKAPGSLLIADKQGKIVYANERVTATTGFSLPEIIGREPGQLWGGHMPQSYYGYLWEIIGVQHAPFVGQIINQRKTGESYRDTLAILPLLDRGAQLELFLALKPAENVGAMIDEFRSMRTNGEAIVPRSFSINFFQWIGLPSKVASQMEGSSLAHFLKHILIVPLQEKFTDRILDRKLIRMARENSEAFHLLYEKYYTTVFGYFLRHLAADRSLVEDLTQETFLRAFLRISQFREENAAYSTYLIRIAHNLLVNYYRREKTATLSSEQVDIRGAEALAARSALDHRSLDWLWECRQLTAIERTILSQFYQQGLSVREIASMHDKSENAIKLHLSRARQKLRRFIVS